MKKTKVYRPRRGMRFSHGRRGVSPAAGFIGGDPIVRTRPDSDPDGAELSMKPTGGVMKSVKGAPGFYCPFSPVISSSSIDLQGSVSMGRLYERGKLNAQLISAPTNPAGGILPGVTPWPSPAVMDVGRGGASPGNPSGTFINSVPGRIEPPSWTHSYLGVNQAFVIGALTSSNQENIRFNTFSSGTETLESSAVPATRVVHTSKEQRFQTIAVKKSASFFDTVPRVGAWVPTTFVSASGTLLNTVTSSAGLNDCTLSSPASFFLDVPVAGKLVDISVWIEIRHDSASVKTMPLGMLAIGVRSPNVHFPKRRGHQLIEDGTNFSIVNRPRPFQTDTFVLWQGLGTLFTDQMAYITDAVTYFPDSDLRMKFPCWDRDLSMRTAFSDGAPTPNPRHNYSVSTTGNFVGSPNAFLGINSAWGMATDWTGSSGSPPARWLTAPGGVANVNEWPTTGSNRGAAFVRPLMPLLDSISVKAAVPPAGTTYPTLDTGDNYLTILPQTRPGLRGTEISGTWQVVISYGNSDVPSEAMRGYLRQARLEITYTTNIGVTNLYHGSPLAANNPGFRLFSKISGTLDVPGGASAKTGTASLEVLSDVPGRAGLNRSFGLQPNTGSFNAFDAALIYRLSGSLADISGTVPGWLFTGPFGMPIIPESSASLVPIVPQPIVSIPFSNFLQPRRALDLSQRLTDVASDVNPQVRLRDLATSFVSSSAI